MHFHLQYFLCNPNVLIKGLINACTHAFHCGLVPLTALVSVAAALAKGRQKTSVRAVVCESSSGHLTQTGESPGCWLGRREKGEREKAERN